MALLLVAVFAAAACSARAGDETSTDVGAAKAKLGSSTAADDQHASGALRAEGASAAVAYPDGSEIGLDTTWLQFLRAMAGESEIECIEDEIGHGVPEGLIELKILDDVSHLTAWPLIRPVLFGAEFGKDRWPHEMWACLRPATAAQVYVTLELHDFEQHGYAIPHAERSCTEMLASDAAYAAGVSRVMHRPQRFDNDADAEQFVAELRHAGRPEVMGCVSESAEVLLNALGPRYIPIDSSFEELECMIQAAVNATREPSFNYAEFYRSLMVEDADDIDDEAYAHLMAVVNAGADECLSADPWDAVDMTAGGFLTEGASRAWVGQPADGWLLEEGEANYFAFEAARGELYEITVSPGTLEDPILALYDGEGTWLDGNDDSGDSLAPRLYWRAPSSGHFFAEVSGYGTGSYTLWIHPSDAAGDLQAEHAERIWETVTNSDATPVVVSPDVWGNLVVATDYSGAVWALDGASGETMWARDVGSEISTPAVISGGVVLVTGLTTHYGIDALSGDIVWQIPGGEHRRGRPAVAGGRAFYLAAGQASDSAVVAVEIATGVQLWKSDVRTSRLPLLAPLTAHGDRLYVSDDRMMHALDTETGMLMWSAEVMPAAQPHASPSSLGIMGTVDAADAADNEAAPTSCLRGADTGYCPTVVDAETGRLLWYWDQAEKLYGHAELPDRPDGAYLAAVDGLHAVDARTGELLWSAPYTILTGTPLAAGDTLYIVDLWEGLAALDASAGAELWRLPDVDASPGAMVLDDGVLYAAASTRQELYAVNAATGELLWTTRAVVAGGDHRGFAVHNGTVFIGYQDGDSSGVRALAAPDPDAR
ncbi:PQQ-binding-like beta-propeller repeat protein [Candidatus Poriferisodalis sp.]|uniref:PQQ-binding-like beta-propeller repeat protein n=1 Tax=Candidatus Poriferisodalis sp. TaxID=3101277 RepID=UPI003B027519